MYFLSPQTELNWPHWNELNEAVSACLNIPQSCHLLFFMHLWWFVPHFFFWPLQLCLIKKYLIQPCFPTRLKTDCCFTEKVLVGNSKLALGMYPSKQPMPTLSPSLYILFLSLSRMRSMMFLDVLMSANRIGILLDMNCPHWPTAYQRCDFSHHRCYSLLIQPPSAS